MGRLSFRVLFKWQVLAISALIATCFSALFFSTLPARDFHKLEIDVTTDQPGFIQLFYNQGEGYSQEKSSRQAVPASNRPIRFGFILPHGSITTLRLDPIDRSAKVTLAKPALVDFRRRSIVPLRITDFVAKSGIEVVSRDADTVVLKSNSDDPSLECIFPETLELRSKIWAMAVHRLGPLWLWVFAGTWILGALLHLLPARFLAGMAGLGRASPITSLALAAALSVVAQCYPMIFFGGSLVSPDYTFFLYESRPTLPDYPMKRAREEPTQGSDVAALLQGSMVYPKLQREALFEHGEWPLWNRHSLGGLPLLGQGQSMFGSLLNFIPILGNSSAASWDLRYLVNRWLYSFGLGVATWLLVRHIGVAAFITYLGVFIGFFTFRFNHMAQLSLGPLPWVLVGWALLARARTRGAVLCLLLANVEVFNSGTVKEAYMGILCINLAGALCLVFSDLPRREKAIRIAVAGGVGACLLLLVAPVWMSFANGLSSGSTHYDAPKVGQAPLWQFLGFFEEMFYRRFHPTEAVVLPSLNFLLFGGVVWLVVTARRSWMDTNLRALGVVAFVAASLAFGLLPSPALLQIPILSRIYHVHNTFSFSLVVLGTLAAAYGFRFMWSDAAGKDWLRRCGEFALIAVAGLLVYHGSIPLGQKPASPYYWSTVVSLSGALFLFLFSLRAAVRKALWGAGITGMAAAVILATWRHGQHLKTPFDEYVSNPGPRVALQPNSEAVRHVGALLERDRARVAGLGYNVFAGYGSFLGWDGIYGVDPIRNPYFDLLFDTADIRKKDWGDPQTWHEENLPFLLPIQDLMNVRYYLANHHEPALSLSGLSFLKSADLDVYESPTCWPRAFFTDRFVEYGSPKEFVEQVRASADRRPFAAVPKDELGRVPPPVKAEALADRLVTPASNFRYTTNTTAFTVHAERAGIVVLSENYLNGDFRAFVNGRSVDYFRVNEACKGIVIPGAGTFEIRFEYRPRHFNLSLGMGAAGLLLFAALLYTAPRGRFSEANLLMKEPAMA